MRLQLALLDPGRDAGQTLAAHDLLHGPRSAQPAHQEIIGRIVAVDDGRPHQLGDEGPMAAPADLVADRLVEDAEVGFGEQRLLVDLQTPRIDRVQSGDDGPELGDAFLREAVLPVPRHRPALVQVHHRDADAPVEAGAQGPDARGHHGRRAAIGERRGLRQGRGEARWPGQGGRRRDQDHLAQHHRRPIFIRRPVRAKPAHP